MKKKILIVMAFLGIAFTAACVDDNSTQAKGEDPKPRLYPIVDSGVAKGHPMNPIETFVMVNKDGSLWTIDVSGVNIDSNVKAMTGSCVYGVIQYYEDKRDVVDIEKITTCK